MMKNLVQQRKSSVPIVAITLLLSAVGCEDSQQASVKGLVTMDGVPMDHGSVLFVAGSKTTAESAPGNIRKDGTYTVQIGQSGKLFVGEYRVEVSARGPSTPHPQGGPPTPGDLITPPHYADMETSGLRYNVRAGENTIDIALVSDSKDEDAALEEEPAEDGSETSESIEESAEKPADESAPESAEEASVE